MNCVHEWEHRNFIVNTIAYPPDNRYLLTGADGGALQLWDTVNGCCVRELAGYTEDVAFVTFSSEGRFALSGGNLTGNMNAIPLVDNTLEIVFSRGAEAKSGDLLQPEVAACIPNS